MLPMLAVVMTRVYITIDTEYSSGLTNGACPTARADNYARSIACITPEGPAGITYQLEVLERYGQKAVFFVDPMPALIWGVAAIEDIVAPILDARQDIQLHCHTEWLELAGSANPLGRTTGRNLSDFAFEDQCRILEFARSTLVAAGAPQPVAFRAGNYGANDDTLRALAELGLGYDTSHCPGLGENGAQISLGADDQQPLRHCGVIEVPVGCIGTLGGGLRHAQITALSLKELTAAVRHARDEGQSAMTFVSHSFELVNRRTLAVNRLVRWRFERFIRDLAAMRGVTTENYRDCPPQVARTASTPLPADPLRSTLRLAEQALSNTLYGAL